MEGESPKEIRFDGGVRPLTLPDIEKLRPILEQWIRNPEKTAPRMEDIDKTQETMRASLRGENNREYMVAFENNEIVGVMGFKVPNPEEPSDGQKMLAFAMTDKPVEFINAYVDTSKRLGKGVGSALFIALEARTREKGFKEILVNSGPNFRKSGWAFWDEAMGGSRNKSQTPDEPYEPIHHVGWARGMYGPGRDAPVWRKVL